MFINIILNFNNLYGICIVSAIIMIFTMLKQIHIIQLNSYNLDQQILWYKKNKNQFIVNIILLVIIILISLSLFGLVKNNNLNESILAKFFLFLFYIFYPYFVPLILIVLFIENLPKKQKKKLVFTKRILRLIVISILIFALFYIPIIFINFKIINNSKVPYDQIFRSLIILTGVALSPLLVFIAYIISLPIENSIRKKFMDEAHSIIKANDNLYVIGITGSFGKTSVKHYLHRILQEKYSVCMTPESFNTAMGATLTVKNDLKTINDIFICEMGARRPKDIKEICDIVEPSGAIITDVGNMHLDTFKNIENVKNTKFELADATINSKNNKYFDKPIILLNGDNELIREKAREYTIDKLRVYYYGLNANNDFYAKILSVNSKGTKFKYCSKIFGDDEYDTKLLGQYNIINLVAAISYALLLKVDVCNIKSAVRSIESVPHRLEIMPYGNDSLLIDDAYNSNPKGARAASDVIASFDGYIKVIITPGMVELNDKQEIENMSFAEYAGKKVDYAIVVGNTNKESLTSGFMKSMDKDKILSFLSFNEAFNYVINNINGKKVILIENDLSDNY